MRERRFRIVLGWIVGMVIASAVWAVGPSVSEVQRLLREGRSADAVAMARGLLVADPGNLELLRLASDAALGQKDGQAAAAFLCQATEHGGTAADFLALASLYRNLFDLEHTLSTYEAAAGRFPTAEVYRAWCRALLDYRLNDEARGRLDEALTKFPADPILQQTRAAVAHEQDQHTEAVRWIRASWASGADHLAWTRDPVFNASRMSLPYTALLSAPEILSGTRALDQYTINLTEKARRGEINHLVGRAEQLGLHPPDGWADRPGCPPLGAGGRVGPGRSADRSQPPPGPQSQTIG